MGGKSSTTKQQSSTSTSRTNVTTTNIDDRDTYDQRQYVDARQDRSVRIDDRDYTDNREFIDARQDNSVRIDDRDVYAIDRSVRVDDRDTIDQRQYIDRSSYDNRDLSRTLSIGDAGGGYQLVNSAGASIEVTDYGAIENAGDVIRHGLDVVQSIVNRNQDLVGQVTAGIGDQADDVRDFLAAERVTFNDALQAAQPDSENLKQVLQLVLAGVFIIGGLKVLRAR